MGNNISYDVKPTVLDLGDKGSIKGLQYSEKSRRFAGIPYALPPTGEYRWRKPRSLPSSFQYQAEDGSPYDATEFKRVCWQELFGKVAKAEGGDSKYTEDCLNVNIWTPVPKPGEENKKWPVVLWLHGGWFAMGDPSQEPGMDPTELISTGELNAVFVAIGYRLNIFGFLASSALRGESGGEAAGNYGLWDQRLAVEWARENIYYFGGDASNMTIGGRSAGAYGTEAQVLYELRRPESRPEDQLFKRFYMISNAIPAQPKTVAESEPQFDEVCEKFGVPSDLSGPEKLAQLRKVPAADLVKALNGLENHTFRPVTDDIFIHSGMVDYIAKGGLAHDLKQQNLKLLIGEVLNEETLYSEYHSPSSGNIDALRTQVGNYYAPATVDRILQNYQLPDSDDLQPWKTLYGNIVADGQVRAPSRFLVKSLVEHSVPLSEIWRYQIQYRLSFITEDVAPKWMGVAHAMDRPIWNYSITHGPTDAEQKLMKEWIASLVAFVNDDQSYQFGTCAIEEHKVMTPDGRIEVQKDPRWDELTRLGAVFASCES